MKDGARRARFSSVGRASRRSIRGRAHVVREEPPRRSERAARKGTKNATVALLAGDDQRRGGRNSQQFPLLIRIITPSLPMSKCLAFSLSMYLGAGSEESYQRDDWPGERLRPTQVGLANRYHGLRWVSPPNCTRRQDCRPSMISSICVLPDTCFFPNQTDGRSVVVGTYCARDPGTEGRRLERSTNWIRKLGRSAGVAQLDRATYLQDAPIEGSDEAEKGPNRTCHSATP